MKRISTLDLVPGMVVADNVMTLDHQLVLAKDSVLTDALITKLELYGVLFIYIDDSKPIPKPEPILKKELTHQEKVRSSIEFKVFKKKYEAELDHFTKHMNAVVEKNAELDVMGLLRRPLQLIAAAKGHINILDMLQNMREFDDSTYLHCLNVALICNLFAKWLHMSDAEVELATACGLFHDIGKILVPKDIITKPGKLTADEFEEIKQHPLNSYNILREQNVDEHIANAALMHHERCDGSGYPLGVKGNQISGFAKMVAIADVYDAMTSARVYRGPLCPFKVIEMFEAEGLQRYDVAYVLPFLEHICDTYLQNGCRLSDGREGTIVMVNKQKLSRPVVKVGDEYINLANEPTLYIDCLL